MITIDDAEALRSASYARGFVKGVLLIALPVFGIAIVVITILLHLI